MTASRGIAPYRGGIMMVDDDEELGLSMTLIVGMKTANGLIVASDGLAGWNTMGQEHLPKEIMADTEKIHVVAPRVVYGVSGSMVNWNLRLQNDISALMRDNPDGKLEDIATAIAEHIPRLYSDRIENPAFFIALFFAGLQPNGGESVMYMINDGKVMAWGEDHPWITVGNDNERSDTYIKNRYKGELLSKEKTVALLKEAIADTATHNKDSVGGHTFVYEITKKGVTRLE